MNPDNNQHSPNENIRIGNFIEGIQVILGDPGSGYVGQAVPGDDPSSLRISNGLSRKCRRIHGWPAGLGRLFEGIAQGEKPRFAECSSDKRDAYR